MIVAIRVRGLVGRDNATESTLRRMHLNRRNSCTLIEDTPQNKGMLLKAKDYITWGEIDAETEKMFKGKKSMSLNSPRKGYGRKGIKWPYSKGGALGNRKEKIIDLLKRMI